MSHIDDEMDFDQFEEKPKKNKMRFLLRVLVILALIVLAFMIYKKTTDTRNIREYDFSREPVYEDFSPVYANLKQYDELKQDEHSVGFYDLEEKIEFIKIENEVYLIPKKNTLVEVYENDNKQFVIKVK